MRATEDGGRIVVAGTPEEVATCEASATDESSPANLPARQRL
jgi:excinuclease UvrABC ATPase subunit